MSSNLNVVVEIVHLCGHVEEHGFVGMPKQDELEHMSGMPCDRCSYEEVMRIENEERKEVRSYDEMRIELMN